MLNTQKMTNLTSKSMKPITYRRFASLLLIYYKIVSTERFLLQLQRGFKEATARSEIQIHSVEVILFLFQVKYVHCNIT